MSKLLARIHQGLYDNEKQLLNLRENALRTNGIEVLDSVEMRLKKISPKVCKRLVGPLYESKRDKSFKCYCNIPRSLMTVRQDILERKVPRDALICNDCWKEDLAATWGYYGFSRKTIPLAILTALPITSAGRCWPLGPFGMCDS